MADIFISYSREDREWVESFAAQVQSEGFSVWWDWDLLVGKRYRETIDHELQSCRVAVVVWSQTSIQSDFVRDEAEEAQQRNILVPVLKEMVRPPAGFRQIQTADLSTWSGGSSHAEFRRVMRGIANLVGRPSTIVAEATDAPVPPSAPQMAATRSMATPTARPQAASPAGPSGASQLLSRLPPARHHLWRYVAFGVIALIGVLLIISQFVSPTTKPGVASVVNGNTAVNGNNVVSPSLTDTGDIGQTGPHPASPQTGGDIGQPGTH